MSKELKNGNEEVVQGGPSSGELFVLFINSLPKTRPQITENKKELDTQSNMFVDDLNSVIGGNTQAELIKNIQTEFNRIYQDLPGVSCP